MADKRIVSFARDEGSIQAIVPVLQALQKSGGFDIQPIAFDPEARPYVDSGIRATKIDQSDFLADPRAFTRAVLRARRPDLVLLGSSAPSGPAPDTPEQYMTSECRDAGVYSVAVLDAWGYYAERFGLTSGRDRRFVPDLICALDRECQRDLLRTGVPAENIAVTHNPWLDRIVSANSSSSAPGIDGTLRVLFVSQPLLENRHVRHWPYTQHELFEQLLAALRRVGQQRDVRLLVWLHPSENREVWRQHIADAPDIAPEICERRGPEVYKELDALVTSHSTLVYEALHLDVPCFNLRPGDPPLARHLPDIVGLTAKAMNAEELAALLLDVGEHSRAAMGVARRRLSAQGIFFSDGHATDRVVALIDSALRLQTR
jgi:hypothetical protein